MAKRLTAKQRRRRTYTVAIAVLVVIVLAVWAAIAFGGSPDEQPTPSPSQSAPPEATDDAAPSDSADYEGLGPSGLPSDAPACEYANLMVTAKTDNESYSGDKPVGMLFTIVNTGDVPCQVNVGTTEQDYEITAGGETVYQYSHCASDRVDQVVTLEPGEERTTSPIEWDRTYSDEKNCDDDLGTVPAEGTEYMLTVYVAGVQSVESATFTLK